MLQRCLQSALVDGHAVVRHKCPDNDGGNEMMMMMMMASKECLRGRPAIVNINNVVGDGHYGPSEKCPVISHLQ